MPREIKYQAWDKVLKEMVEVTDLRWEEGLLVEINTATYVHFPQEKDTVALREFTGLHDKNGKEIWESDIVTAIEDGEELYTAFVECDAPNGGFNLRDFDGEYIEIFHNEDKLVIIGNIYENPELLEQ